MTNSQKKTYYENTWLWMKLHGETKEDLDEMILNLKSEDKDFEDKKKILNRLREQFEFEEEMKALLGDDIRFDNIEEIKKKKK